MRLTDDAFFTLSTRGLGLILSQGTGIVLRLDDTTVLDSRLSGPASLPVGVNDRVLSLHLTISGRQHAKAISTLVAG